jgi:hypothetical protein
MNDTAPTSAVPAAEALLASTAGSEPTTAREASASSAAVAVLGAVYAYVLVYLGYAYFYFTPYPHAGGM